MDPNPIGSVPKLGSYGADSVMIGLIITIVMSAAVKEFVFLLFYKSIGFVENSVLSAGMLCIIGLVGMWTFLYLAPERTVQEVV